MKTLSWLGLVLLFVSVLMSGCASMFTANTTASYITPDGKEIRYSSDKEQTGLDAVYELYPDGTVKAVRIKVDKASTPEAAIAAALQVQTELMRQLIPLLKAGAPGP